jgi:hypothetical protein
MCVHACLWVLESVGVCMCVRACSLDYPACKAYAPHCNVICGLSGSTVFSAFSHKRHDSRKTFTEHKMCVLIFSTILF